MEVGAGVGNFAVSLLNQIPLERLVLVEPAVNLQGRLEARFTADARVKIVKGELGDCGGFGKFDTLIAVNVIEHIEDDSRFLRQAYELLAPGGTVVLFAPALQSLYGSLDAAFDHFRRYSRAGMATLLTRGGFSLEHTRYLNFPGVFSWFLAGKVLRQATLKPAQVRFYDRYVIPVVSRVEGWCEPPIGQNLLAIACKPKDI
jgi:SAM-dependent methyltransferase